MGIFKRIFIFVTIALATAYTLETIMPAEKTKTEIKFPLLQDSEEIEIQSLAISDKDIECLAKNMYYEARGEGILGITLVANVTINRAMSGVYPSSICGVVYQKSQFSWTLEKHKKMPYEQLKEYTRIAKGIVTGKARIPPQFKEATHYYAISIDAPRWTKSMEYLGQSNNHKFYKDPEVNAVKQVSYMK
jgi:spore germination cell wall hydrolase CwlJ-like protein